MSDLITEEEGKGLGAVSATSTAAVPSTQLHTSARDTSHLRDQPTSKAIIDYPTPTSSSTVQPPIAQTQLDSQPVLVSPYTTPPVTLLVGGLASPSRETEPVPFYVHADLLTSISSFFRAAFGSSVPTSNDEGSATSTCGSATGFKESQTRTMTLPEERPEDVRYLLQWVYWKAAMSTSDGVAGRLSRSTSHSSTHSTKSGCPLQSSTSPSTGAGALWHTLIDPPLQALTRYNSERAIVAKAAEHGDISQLTVPRPTPPAFGPLVRLWLFAERLDIRGGLRDDIVERVLDLSRLGNCVPGMEDVWALWESGVDCGGGGGKLKDLVLDLYVGMRCWGLFREDAGGQWHEGFLLDLVRRFMWEVHGDWKGWRIGRGKVIDARTGDELEDPGGEGNIKDKGTGKGADEEFVMVGGLRRRRCGYHDHS